MKSWMRRAVCLGAFLVTPAVCVPLAGGEPSHAPIRVHVTLRAYRVVAGDRILGTVVLTNTSHSEITVNTCAIDGWLTVGLSGRVDSFPFFHSAVGCPPSIRIAPGTNRFPVTVVTTYASCTQPQPSGTPPSGLPTCVASGAPPLPAGRYTTKLDIVGLTGLTRTPNRVVVTLMAPAKAPAPAPCTKSPSSVPNLVVVPDVIGDTSSGAALVFAKACLNAAYASPVGTRVVSESPAASTKVPEYSTVTLGTQ